MLLNKCVASGSPAIKLGPRHTKHNPSLAYVPPVRASAACPKFRSLSTSYQERKPLSLRGGPILHLSGASASFLRGDHGSVAQIMPLLNRHSKVWPRSSVVCKASKSFFSYPQMTSKPKWWWRTLACIPYLLPLHYVWFYADTVYQLHHILEDFEFLTSPFLDTIALLPNWFMMVVLYVAYLGVVKRKEWPHFLRFHVTMALLLDTALQAMAIACGWMPNAVYRGMLGTYFWATVAYVQMYTVLECMRCALAGKYADVPFVSDAAYFHTDLLLFGL
ncbi:protein TIC 20-I, chloroplastic-like isoform X2 [Phoenix dactylifera]|nr:protein TIC 20-I, chloroplastic-like isoform X2 [Phoenix dactylifera]